jgi:hypothetical protein
MYIDLRDLPIYFLEGNVISDTTDGLYNTENINVLVSGSLNAIISQIKEIISDDKR